VSDPTWSGGQENFATLATLSLLQGLNGRAEESQKTFDRALNHPTAQAVQIHQAGRQLLASGQKEQAMRVFQFNAKRYPNQWPVHVGLMRGYAAMGDKEKALEEAKLAVAQAPDEGNRKNLQGLVKQLEEGKDIN
jgi:Flp pilus assembly protein TadD